MILAGSFSVLTALLLMRVAQGSPQTALAVLAQGGTANVLLGSALSIVPLVAAGAVGGILGHLWRPPFRHEGWRGEAVRLGWSLAVLAVGVVLAPPALVAAAAVMALVVRKQSDDVPDGKGAAATVLLVLVWLLWVAKPWWPLERVELSNDEPLIGFVLSSSGRDSAVLLAEPRRVVFVPSADVTDREICAGDSKSLDRWFYEPTWSMIADPAGYPSCEG